MSTKTDNPVNPDITDKAEETDPLRDLYVQRVTDVLDNLDIQCELAEEAKNRTNQSPVRIVAKAVAAVIAAKTDEAPMSDELAKLLEEYNTVLTERLATIEVNREEGDKLAKAVDMFVTQTIMFELPETVKERATALTARWAASRTSRSSGSNGPRSPKGSGNGQLVLMSCSCGWRNMDSTDVNSARDRIIAKHAAHTHADVLPVRPMKGDADWQATTDAIKAVYSGQTLATAELGCGLVFTFTHGGTGGQ